jgi:Pro-kumamolisin, activation domain/Bacterial Ig-like domain (group 3)
MPRISGPLLLSLMTAALLLAASAPASSQSQPPAPRSRVLQAVDDTRVTTLSGNTHPMARPEFDQGTLADATPLSRIVLILQRSAEQESALQQLIDQQQDKTSSTYHQWLTPETFGGAFGPSDRDLATVTGWLANHNFTGIQVNAARTFIEFSGTAGTVHAAFRTSMHRYAVQGRQNFANSSDPAVPAALAPVVAGIASLNNFPRRAASHRLGNFRYAPATNRTKLLQAQIQPSQTQAAQPSFTINDGGTFYGVTPYDFAAIYNVLPLWNASTPIDGTGQTIAIVGQTDINPADFVNFRKLFNLPLGNTATPTGTQYLNIIYNGPKPGVTGDEGEADIDTQWSSAVAKGATIDYVVSQSTEVMQGTDLSALYIVNNNLAPVMSYSYGQCELFLGTSGNTFYKTLWQQAAAQGITVLLASGDSGAAGCDNAGVPAAADGIAVNGLASTPYNIAVGGTDFYMPNGGTAFWSPTNDPTTQASARGYIPETPWNESCTNSVFSTSHNFYGQTPEQVCNSALASSNGLLSVVGAGGGPSACIQSNGSSSSSCRGGYPKPSWQTGTGVPSDGVRDTPDVSLFSSAGFFGAFYVVCQQSTNADGQPCSLAGPAYDFAGYGGTSAAAPVFAGILSLVNQKTGSRQGNANYVLYNLASQQNRAGTACNANSGTPAAGCVFNDVTSGTIAMPCLKGTLNCNVTTSTDRYGILSGYASTTGYDLATGLGSVNAANLVNSWSNASFTASAITLTLSPSSITHGTPVSASVRVASTGGTPTGSVSINALASNGSVQDGTLQNGSYTGSLSNFPGGAYSVQAHYAGDGTYAPSDSNPVTLTVSPESSTTTLHGLLYNPANGATTSLASGASYPYGGFFLLNAQVAGTSGQGTATGNITLTDSGTPIDGGTFRLNSTSNTEDQTRALAPVTHVLTVAYSGDASFNASTSSPYTLNITKAPTDGTLQANLPVLSAASNLSLSAQISARGYGSGNQQGFGAIAPSGFVIFTSGGQFLGSLPLTQSTYPTASSDSGSVTLTIPASQLPIGNNAITANYLGDANYNASSSPSVTVTVTGATQSATLTTLSESATQAAPGAPYTFTATVTSLLPPGTPRPTGTVTFYVDGHAGATATLSSGVARVSNDSLTIGPGPHFLNAVYSGDTIYQSSSDTGAFTITTLTAASTTTLTVTPSTVAQGTGVTVIAAISPVAPTPTGTAQLMLDGNLYGAPVALTGATTNLPLLTNTLQSGEHILRVFYSGDSAHQANTSASATFTILDDAGAFTLSPSTTSTSAIQGKSSNPVTLTATPTGGFHSTITFACTGGLPSGAVCLFTPSTVTPTGAGPATTSVIISPATVGLQSSTAPLSRELLSRTPRIFSSGTGAASGLGVTLAGLLFVFLPRRTRRWSVFTLLFALTTLGLLSGCGSGGVDPNGQGPNSLSTGSYAVSITATGGSTIQTATINLTIQ